MQDTEIWKDIPNFEGLYQVSNLGRIKKLAVTNLDTLNRSYYLPEKISKQHLRDKRYPAIHLTKNKTQHFFRVHTLVMLAFVGESDMCVDHIDNNSQNNHLTNLRYISHRRNILYGKRDQKRKHKYPGIWVKPNGNYGAVMQLKGKTKHLGTFKDPKEASEAYLKAIENL